MNNNNFYNIHAKKREALLKKSTKLNQKSLAEDAITRKIRTDNARGRTTIDI
jgi:hypothetical protein